MIDYVMPITIENLEALRDMGFILSRGCREFITGDAEGFQVMFLDYNTNKYNDNPMCIFNMESDEGKPIKTVTLQNAKDIMLLINLGLNIEDIRESIKEIM